MLQILLTLLGIGLSVFMLYFYETAQLVDECFKPLEPVKTFKDANKTKSTILVIVFSLLVYLAIELLYPF